MINHMSSEKIDIRRGGRGIRISVLSQGGGSLEMDGDEWADFLSPALIRKINATFGQASIRLNIRLLERKKEMANIFETIKAEVEGVLDKHATEVETAVSDVAGVVDSGLGVDLASLVHLPPIALQELGVWLTRLDGHIAFAAKAAAPSPDPTAAPGPDASASSSPGPASADAATPSEQPSPEEPASQPTFQNY